MKTFVALAFVLVACGGDDDGNTPVDAGPDGQGEDAAVVCADVTWPAPTCTATDVEGKLRCIPDLQVTRRADADPPGYQRYDLVLTQPIDHDQPSAGTFPQRIMLLHSDPVKPVVLSTSGYGLGATGRLTELTQLFGANQIAYEHRFFTPSRPEPADWTKLDIHQAARDAHRITEALRWMYAGNWVNTGASKGGMTSAYQRRFHPCDVDATVSYVAPTSLGVDQTYVTFLEQVGGAPRAQCRADLIAFQNRLLVDRAEIIPLVQGTFTQIPVAKVFELAVVELSFAFWQYTSPDDPARGCAAIPAAGATPAEMLAFLELHSGPSSLADDASLAYFRPYYHQAAAQLGAPAPYETPIAANLQYPGADIPASFLPTGEVPAFDAAAMPDVNGWMAADAERVMLIYGELDPWSARPFAPDLANDNAVFIVPGGNHGARISQLPTSERDRAVSTLVRWLEAPAVRTSQKQRPSTVPVEDRVPR
ncbi:MAG: S28 family serine protease [Kofleriaceae bacterium]